MRDLDMALFLAGESTLTAAEVAEWATSLGFPTTVPAAVHPGEQLQVSRAESGVERWRAGNTVDNVRPKE